MKKIFYIITFFVLSFTNAKAQQVCCPEFKLVSTTDKCYSHPVGGTTPHDDLCQSEFYGCKHTKEKYYITPQKTGYTYTWTVVGGTISSATGNPKEITWGNTSQGEITVVISNQNGTCKKTINEKLCLLDAPVAGFSFVPNSAICANQMVQFTDTSTGAKTWTWDFGDGTTSTAVNPTHSYSASGTYTVTLTVSNSTMSIEKTCGCSDTITKTIIIAETGIQIISSCKQMLCKGDKASYTTVSPCSSYNWTVTGGHIEGASNSETVEVVWDGSYPATVNMTGTCTGTCGNSGTLTVPVLYPSIPVLGQIVVCPNDFETYTLPSVMPGTTYSWTVTGGSISGFNANTNVVNIQWGNTVGEQTITCNYSNSLTKCNGTGTLKVKILPRFKISGNSSGCLNETFTYAANGNANWTITPTTGSSPSTFTNVSSITGTWASAGTFTVFATPVTPTDYCAFPDSIIVNVLPKPILGAITGPTTICPSKPYTYSVTSNRPGGIYNWTVVGGVVTGSGSTVSITWNAIGPYTLAVTQTVDNCTGNNNQTLTVTTYPKPEITGPDTSCMDIELIYSTTTLAPAGGYEWSLSNALGSIVSGQGTNTIHVLWHGSTNPPPNKCDVILKTCGGTTIKTVEIITPPTAIITKSNTLCSVGGMTLATNISSATSYVWEKDGVVQSLLTTQNVNILDHGTYTVTITKNGCKSKASIIIPKENAAFTANIAATNKTFWKCSETVNTNLVVTPMPSLPPSGSYCYKWFQGAATGAGSPVGIIIASYTATSAGYYWCEVSICGTGCKFVTSRISVIKESCSGGSGCTIDNYDPDFTSSNDCSKFTFSTTNVPYSGGAAFWYFGDGEYASGSTVTHNYKGIGTYSVCARYGNGVYCYKEKCHTVTVTIANNFSATVNCNQVTFTNLCQELVPGSITNYNWQFPGGSTSSSTLANPLPITYATGGLHTATLEITDNTGCKIKYAVEFSTIAIPASFTVPTPICAGSKVPFTVAGTDPDLSYSWNFGDGFVSNLQTTDHIYATSGTKTVTLTVTHKNGCSSNLPPQTVTILPAITASIGTDKKMCPNDKVTLSVTTSFATYQWYKDGVAIAGATAATYDATQVGDYTVLVGKSAGCTAFSNKINVSFYPLPIVKINADKTQCTAKSPIKIQNNANETGANYLWTVTGPAPLTMTNVYNPNPTATVPGEYNFELTVTSKDGCVAKDAICITLVTSPTLTITAPTGTLCEGKANTFTAVGTSNTTPTDTVIKWSNGVFGNTMTTGVAGTYSATIANAAGCTATAFAGTIKSLPNVSLFPKGCQTACLTDTINFPLPMPSIGTYTVTWFDDDGTSVATVGTGVSLPLSTFQPGIHHLHATVSISGGCEATTGILDLNIKDCTLLPECDNCKDLLSKTSANADKNITSSSNAQISNETITFTILKPVKEVRISLADIKYYWKDPACADCKIQMLERGCLFAASTNQALGTLTPETATATNSITTTAVNNCPDELIWKSSTLLQPGTYTIPLQLSLPKPLNKNCVLVLEKACFHLTLIDFDCKKCETVFCKKDKAVDPNECACNAGNNWSNLYLTSNKPGKPKIKNQIICGDTMTDIDLNASYLLSGVYNCKGKCPSIKNEITVYNQVNEIIYTHQTTALIENITFPAAGMYSVSLTATCGDKKCVCNFRINVNPSRNDDPIDFDEPIGNSNPTKPEDPKKPIEEIIKEVLPPDFNGGVLVSKNDDILFEKYYSFKDNVTSHTAFDLASVTKTFTSMAILKLMEDGKLSVDDAVAKHLTGFPIPEITIKMLLSHKSGLEDYLKFIDESDWDKKKNLTNADLLQFIIKNKSKVMINTPGKTFDYSNTNFALLALIIEKTSGQLYKDYLSNTFFKPLQMTDTYMLDLDNYAKATKSYYKNGKTYSMRYLDLVYGDKNIYSTVQDLKKWDKALRNGKMFKKTTLDLAYAPTSKLTPFESNYGLGWKKITTTGGKEVIYHTGWWAGSRSLLMRLPAENVMIAVTSNNNFSNIADIKKLCDLFGDYQLTGRKIENF